MQKKIASFLENQRKTLEHKEIESEYIRIFNNFDEEVNHELGTLNESPQLMNLVAIGDEFRNVCDQIGNDAQFKGFYKFLALVRIKDREMAKKIDFLKDRFEFENPEKARVQVLKVDLPKQLSDRFFHTLHSYQEEIKSREEDQVLIKKQKEEDKIIRQKERAEKQNDLKKRLNFARSEGTDSLDAENSFIAKIQLSVVDKLHPELIPENQSRIEEFRKNSTPEVLGQFQKSLEIKEEIKIFEDYHLGFKKLLDNFELEGNYAHIKAYLDAWFKYCEDLAHNCEGTKTSLKSTIRAAYRGLEEWFSRVKIKYEGTQFRNSNESTVDITEMDKEIKKYKQLHEEYILNHENKRIWDYIKNEQKLKEKAQRDEDKAREQEELAKLKAIEAEEKEKLKAERELQKELERKEKEKLAEQKRQEDLKKKEEEKKRKEFEKQEKERLAEEKRQEDLKRKEEERKQQEADEKERAKLAELKQQEEIEQQKRAKALDDIHQAELKLIEEENKKSESGTTDSKESSSPSS